MGLFSLLRRAPRLPRPPVDLASPAFKADPFPFYARLRAEAPVYRIALPTRETAWLLTRYDDVALALKDERFVKDPSAAMSPEQADAQPWFRKMFKALKRNMLDLDPPDHTRLRALVQKAFTPRLVEQMRPRVEALTNEFLDHALDRAGGRGGRFDLIRDYALPLPTTIIAEMLGVPVSDRHHVQRWSKALISAAASGWRMMQAVPNAWAFLRYLRGIVKKRRARPQNDLVSALASAEEAGDKLSEDELLAMVFLLLVAGHETTVNLIGNGTLTLLQHPAELARLRADPSIIKPAIEELLRFASPVETSTERYAREDVTLHGVTIPRGEMVFPVILSANRDERVFADPDALNLTREPNRHLSFGLGHHFCLGAPLARLEGQIAVTTLLRRVPELRLAVRTDALRWRPGLIVRGLQALPVECAQ